MDNNIHNWYEKLVRERLAEMSDGGGFGTAQIDDETLSDIACVALNRLPPRYVRHAVDMSFYMSGQEQAEMNSRVQSAINDAVQYVVNKNQDFQLKSVQTN